MPALTTQQALDLAIQFHRAGRLAEAEGLYRRLLAVDPRNPDALHLLGALVNQNGAREEALALVRQAITVHPTVAFYYNSLGNLLQERGELAAAVAAYQQALAREPELAMTHNNLGNTRRALGDLEAAMACYREALRLDPSSAEAHLNLGIALHAARRWGESIPVFHRALALQPGNAVIHTNLANAFLAEKRTEEAMAAFGRALELDPRLGLALNNLANLLKDRGELDAALPLYRRAVDAPDGAAWMFSNYLAALHYATGTTLEQLAAAHQEYERRFAAAVRSSAFTRPPDRLKAELRTPLRLGFVSPHFENHPVGSFLIRLLENLDREQFRVICYSDTPREDAMTARLRACAEAWRETARDSAEQLAQRISLDNIDILFDLAGHTAGHRLPVFARKPAPIQITWVDYVGTTGLSAMDYIIGDPRQIPPEAEKYYREKVLRMPDDYITFDPPAAAPEVGPLPALANGYVTFGSFNIPPKTTPLTIEVWSRVLHQVPKSRLLIKNGGFDDPAVSTRYQQLLSAQGIDGERVEFRGWSKSAELLATYNEVDIALDTIPYNGGLTTCEALWMGVPVITCPGKIFASRHGLAHLTAAGFTETIARDHAEYVRLAVALAGDLPRLSAMRQQLRARVAASPLCDGPRFASHFTALIREVWRQWCMGMTNDEYGVAARHRTGSAWFNIPFVPFVPFVLFLPWDLWDE